MTPPPPGTVCAACGQPVTPGQRWKWEVQNRKEWIYPNPPRQWHLLCFEPQRPYVPPKPRW